MHNLEQYKDDVDWSLVSKHKSLSETTIRTFKDKVDWYLISKYQTLSEEFINEFKLELNWNQVSSYQILTEDFITENQYRVNWYNISLNQNLSEKFIRKFSEKVDWTNITEYNCSNLSKEFIESFKNKFENIDRGLINLDTIKGVSENTEIEYKDIFIQSKTCVIMILTKFKSECIKFYKWLEPKIKSYTIIIKDYINNTNNKFNNQGEK